MPDVLDAAVVGAGTIGARHARLLSEHPSTALRAVVDIDEDVARDVAGEYGADVALTDTRELFDRVAPDAVVVATPETAHLEPTERALSNDCHVLLEKPIAETEADARRIGELARDAGTTLMVAYCCRFDPEYAGLKREVDAGEFGDLLGIQAARVGSIESYERVAGWTHPVYYLAVHDIDMMQWYVDAEITRLCSYATGGVGEYDAPAVISTTLAFDSGLVGTLETNWARPEGHPVDLTQELRLTGTEGYSRLVVQDDGVPLSTSTGFDFAPTSEFYGRIQDMYRLQLDHFVECVRENSEPLVTWEDGLRSLSVANAIRESVESGDPVSL